MWLTQTQISNSSYTVVGIVTHNYPFLILNVLISSFVDKVFNHSGMASFSCHMQGSYLIEEKDYKVSQKSTNSQVSTIEVNEFL